jgi:hypothetical protein
VRVSSLRTTRISVRAKPARWPVHGMAQIRRALIAFGWQQLGRAEIFALELGFASLYGHAFCQIAWRRHHTHGSNPARTHRFWVVTTWARRDFRPTGARLRLTLRSRFLPDCVACRRRIRVGPRDNRQRAGAERRLEWVKQSPGTWGCK